MNRIRVTEEKKMTVAQRTSAMPYELLSDGVVVGVFKTPEEARQENEITCPNCKFVVPLPKKDNAPAPFSVQHP